MRDPIEDWLGTDVELLPPRPGSFERIHRRARRRKTVVAMSTAAAAVVVIAAAATLPQLASIFPGNGGPSKVNPLTSQSHTQTPSRHPSTSPSGHHRQKAGLPGSSQSGGSNLATGSTLPATRGIAPTSVTFVNGSTGAVIGETTSSCPAGCEAVAGTYNYAHSWFKVDAPPAGPPNGDSGVSQIRFLEPRNGWAFGPELYVTHRGGATWAKVHGLPGRVIDLATVGGSAYAVVARCTGTGASYASGCTRFWLYTSQYSSDSFQPVPGAAGRAAVTPGGLQLTGQYGYLLAGHVLYSGSPAGGSWQRASVTSGPVPRCLNGKGYQAASDESGLIAPSSAGLLYLVCQTPTSGSPGGPAPVLYQSADAGQTWHLDGKINSPGTLTSVAVAPYTGRIVAATDSTIIYSPNARTWRVAIPAAQAPALGFSFVGMTTQNYGVAVTAAPSKRIYITTDGGLTWRSRTIG